MAQLIVRNIEEQLVQELELRAARNAPSGPSLKELLSELPDVGTDGDFDRIQDLGRSFA